MLSLVGTGALSDIFWERWSPMADENPSVAVATVGRGAVAEVTVLGLARAARTAI